MCKLQRMGASTLVHSGTKHTSQRPPVSALSSKPASVNICSLEDKGVSLHSGLGRHYCTLVSIHNVLVPNIVVFYFSAIILNICFLDVLSLLQTFNVPIDRDIKLPYFSSSLKSCFRVNIYSVICCSTF